MASRRVLEQIEAWRKELVNLNRTNRLLYFRHSKTSTVTIHGRTPDELLSRMDSPSKPGWGFETTPTETLAGDHVRTDKDDPRLQEAALRTLERKAMQEYLDKGLWVLYVALGMLVWKDPQDDREAHSPIVLVPVSLSRENPREPYRLKRVEEDLVVNPALEVKLRNDFDVALPGLEVAEAGTLDAFFDEVESATQVLNGRVERTSVLAPFSFHKEVMFRDLLNSAEQIAEHPIVNALADPQSGAGDSLAFEPMSEERLDTEAPPEDMASVLSADSSQRRCIVAARSGHSFVMDGPPGTGKSQTITNIIAELLKGGRTVLFVSEKAAALEVVRGRLKQAGLGDFVLELHSHKATRKEVAQELGRALTQRVVPGPELPAIDRRAALRDRQQLTDYSIAMNEPRGETGRSLHDTLGRLAQLDQAPSITRPHALALELTPDELADVLDVASALGRAWGPVERGEDFLWRSSNGRRPRSTLLPELREVVAGLTDLAGLAATQTRLSRAASVAEFRREVPLLEHLEDPPDVPAQWLVSADLKAVESTRAALGAAVVEHRKLEQAFLATVGPSYRQLQNERLASMSIAADNLRQLHWTVWPALGTEQARNLTRFLRGSASQLNDMHKRAETVARAFGLPSSALNLRRVELLAELGQLVAEPHRPEVAWLDPLVQSSLQHAIAVLGQLVEEYRQRESALSDTFTAEVLTLDLPELERRFRDVHKGFRKWGGAYRVDKQIVAAVSRSGKAKSDVVGRLGEAREWQSLSRRLEQAEGQHAGIIGPGYYRRTATDFGAVVAAVDVARRAVELLGRDLTTSEVATQLAVQNQRDPFLPQEAQKLLADVTAWRSAARSWLGQDPPDLPLAELADWCLAVSESLAQLTEHAEHVEKTVHQVGTLTSAWQALAQRQALHDLEARYTPDDSSLTGLLGHHYVGIGTDLNALEENLKWTMRLRQLLGHPISTKAAETLLNARPDTEAPRTACNRWEKLQEALLSLFEPSRQHELRQDLDGPFAEVDELLAELHRTVADIDEWRAHSEALAKLTARGLLDSASDLIDRKVPADKVLPALERAVFEAHVDHLMETDHRLSLYRSADRDHLVQEYQSLDRLLLQSASSTVINALNSRRPRTATGVAGVIQREAQKKTRHMPVRKLLAETAAVTQRLKPCFMMSPLTVSQFLTSEISFDAVIFDEASQVLPADAVNCIYRGQQVIVAGDQKQLPPTSFFMGTTSSDDSDDYDEDQLDEFESVLDLCKGSGGFPSLPLQWHYRSQHESLITFSNYSFYEGKLVTFPGAIDSSPDVGVELLYVADGVYRRGGPRDNPREAAVVVDRVLAHARQLPDLTCGVVALSETQAAAIEMELERRRRQAPELDGYFAADRLDGFFIKALENVQGDERDIIIFSVGYGPDENGKILNTFGPIIRTGGWRRLNVAATRARRRVEVVSSITAGDIRDTTNESLLHLKRYLDYAERGMPALAVNLEESMGGADSPFEEEVTAVLRGWGYDVVPQVGSAGYRIDMGVRHPARPGSFALGIECDGVMYHSSRVARDRDRLREEVLRGLGWHLHRIWGTAWYRDRPREEERLHQAVRDAIAQPIQRKSRITEKAPPMHMATEEVDFSEPPAWTSIYVICRLTAKTGGYEITDPQSQPELVRIVKQVVAVEGPIHRDRLVKRTRESFSVGRTGSRVRAAVEQAVARSLREGAFEERDQFYGETGSWHAGVRVWDAADNETRRTVDEVPMQELRLALTLNTADAHVIDREPLLVSTARILGWARLGADIRARLESALDDAVNDGQLIEENGQLRVP